MKYTATFDVVENDKVCFTGQMEVDKQCHNHIKKLVKARMKDNDHREVQIVSTKLIEI